MIASSAARTRVVVLFVCLLVVTAAVPVALGTASYTDSDDDSSATDDVDVSDSLRALEDGETVELVVRFEEATIPDGMTDREVEDHLESHAEKTQAPLLAFATQNPAVSVEEEFWLTNAVLLEVQTDRVDIEEFERFDAVEAIHENFELSIPDEPRDDGTGTDDDGSDWGGSGDDAPSTTWGVDAVGAPTVWEHHGTRGDGVRVAVLDTGVDADHPDLELYTDDPTDPTYPGGWAEFNETGDRITGSTPHDSATHGTHVSGTIAGGNERGTAIGVAPDVELIHGLVLEDNDGTFAQIVAGMEWALEEDADVISMSFGAPGYHDELIDPVRHATEGGVVVVSAIGNDGSETSGSPANVYESISVGAVDADGSVASFSGGERINRTEWTSQPEEWPGTYVTPDVVAPGVEIESTVPGGEYERLPGTSMATPHVSGTVALALSIEPEADSDELISALTESAGKPDGAPSEKDTRYGYGTVDANATVNALVDARTVDESPASATGTERTQTESYPGPADVFTASVAFVVSGVVLAAVLLAVRRRRF
ncbi:S8 family serine peptidase [Natrarchaeobius chitinivorans]|uniref:S8 family serine peptidase n=1 Tax=Natrarchaeobius chitinivorans TaxID=1679083 RepID=UPI001FB4540D|nr:S8 family serine peptidase [Natrarchaeobius chitinivorans]